VTGYTMSSASGTNYTLPMGDPVAAFLFQHELPTGSMHEDTDGDSLPNALEFLLGGNPKVADAAVQMPMMTLDTAEGELVYQFDVRAATGNVTWTVEHSGALNGWASAVAGQDG
jgi:hypothetical protein